MTLPWGSSRFDQAAAHVVGGGGSSFLPTDLTGLIGWYKADTGVTTSSGNVTAVTDQSPAHNNLVNVGTVPLNASSAYNSHPAFDFTIGNNAALVTGTNAASSSVTLTANITALSIFFVGRMNSASSTFARPLAIAGGSDADYNSVNNITLVRNSGAAALNTTYNGTNYATTTVTLDANMRFGTVLDGSTVTTYVNGVAGTPVALTTFLIFRTGVVGTNTNFIIGNTWGPAIGGAAWDGPILEMVIATSALSSTEAASLNAYFVARLGA